jgi:ferritin-like metal-binding protein YciE
MQLPSRRFSLAHRTGNLSTLERWVSTAAGVGLLLSATRGSAAARIARGGVGANLLARGTTGYCGVKSALQGETTLSDGLKQQWQRLTETVSSAKVATSLAARIDSMETMYSIELQELHSAETQLCALANKLVPIIDSAPLAFRLQEYATELQLRKVDLESRLARSQTEVRVHPDDAMQALITETNKMAQVCADKVRDAAIAASLQRIIHYKIAGYGTIASYAKALGRLDEAGHFAQSADRDKAVDGEITELAKGTLNPEATQAPSVVPTPITTH